VPAADARGLHPPVGGEVGRAERDALHAGRGAADLLDVGHAARGLEDGVHEDRPGQPGLGLELGEDPVDVVDVLGPCTLGTMMTSSLSPISVTSVVRSSSTQGLSRR
jgi:hypothetical protein